MSAETLPDGSVAEVEPSGPDMSTISRKVDGVTVWAQVFSCSVSIDKGAHERQVATVLDAIRAEPGDFHRWWFS